MTTFVDTSGVLATLNARDEEHPRASSGFQALLEADEPLVSTNYVVLETVSLLQRRLGLEAVRTFENDILPLLELHWVDPEIHRVAMTALLKAGRRRLSLVDCTSFEVMRRRKVTHAFALDPHFGEHGFEQVPPLIRLTTLPNG